MDHLRVRSLRSRSSPGSRWLRHHPPSLSQGRPSNRFAGRRCLHARVESPGKIRRCAHEQGRKLVCVYIKTHSDSALNLQNVERQGFAVLSRKHLLEVLNAHEVQSDIYMDFRDRLRELERLESCFDKKMISDWNGTDWKGLYQAIEQRRSVVNWGYVNNPAGGFWNLVLNWFDHEGVCPYMQIEQGNLCFKVGEVYESHRDVRGQFHNLLMSASLPDMGLQRPGRFGSGTYMTVAVVPRQVWLGADDQIIDIDSVIARLGQYESWLKKIIEEAEQ